MFGRFVDEKSWRAPSYFFDLWFKVISSEAFYAVKVEFEISDQCMRRFRQLAFISWANSLYSRLRQCGFATTRPRPALVYLS
jgi:hypothetical protein